MYPGNAITSKDTEATVGETVGGVTTSLARSRLSSSFSCSGGDFGANPLGGSGVLAKGLVVHSVLSEISSVFLVLKSFMMVVELIDMFERVLLECLWRDVATVDGSAPSPLAPGRKTVNRSHRKAIIEQQKLGLM